MTDEGSGVCLRRRALTAGLAGLVLVGALGQVPAGAGEPDQSVRYVDEVFAGVTETNDIAYGEAVNNDEELETLELDLFEPTGDTNVDRPVLIWVHGGGFTSGDKSSAVMRRLAQSFARRGYVTASINYRLGDDESIPTINAATEDLRTAVRWFRANADPTGGSDDFPLGRDLRIDPDRISGGGYSAGAVMALAAGYNVGKGPFGSPGSNRGWSSELSGVVSLAGASAGQASADDAPALFFHGDQDTRVWYDNGPFGFSGVETCERARIGNLDCVFRTYPGVAHGLPGASREPEILAMTAHFLSCRPGAVTSFTDVAGRWFEDAAGFAQRHEFLTGFGDGTFRGDEGMTRAQAVSMLYRYVGSPDVTGMAPHLLTDVPPWIESAVVWALDAGIMTGFGNDTFRPGESLNRGQITRAMHRLAGSVATDGLADHGFTDVPDWVDGEVRWVATEREGQTLAGSSIMTGFDNGTFRPTVPVTRAQAARALLRLAHPASAWSTALQTDPPAIACYRVGDPS